MVKKLSILYLLFFLSSSLFSQVAQDSIPVRKGSFIVLPATAYTPETGFTIGAINQYFFDVAKDGVSRMSYVQAGGIYTSRKNIYAAIDLNLFSKGEEYIGVFRSKYSDFKDRDYGLGNDARALIYNYHTDGTIDSLNYLEFNYKTFAMEVSVLKKIQKGLYAGVHFWAEKLWNYKALGDSLVLVQTERDEFNPKHYEGTRSGISWVVTYDNRTNSVNPLDGTYVQFKNWYYGKWLGSDYTYTGVSLDARHYINTYKDQTLALRFRNEQRYPMNGSLLPKFEMPRVGGKEFARGYYEGTYQDNHLLAFEIEYRMPLWQKKGSKIWEFWKRAGVVAFMSGSRVYENWSKFSLHNMRYTVGLGGRYVLSEEHRVNARLDIGLGLDPNSGFKKRNLGIYIYVNEAF